MAHFGGELNSGSPVKMSREKNTGCIHRNVRLFLLLMVNVEVPVSDQLQSIQAAEA